MLLTVVPHRGSALPIQIIWQWVMCGWGKSTPSQNYAACWAADSLPRKIIPRGTSWKEQKHCSTDHLLSGLLKPPQTTNFPFENLPAFTLGGSWIPQDWWGDAGNRKMSHYFFSTRELPLKDPGAFQAHFSVVRWHHFWVQAYACHFTFIMEWPVQFQPASPIPTLCFYPPICIKHRVPTCSITTLDPQRVKSCLILQSVSSFELNHIWEKKTIPFLTFISRSLTVPR